MDKFVRPGIDDRPDYDKALTPEQRDAVSRLATSMPERRAGDASQTDAQVQAVIDAVNEFEG